MRPRRIIRLGTWAIFASLVTVVLYRLVVAGEVEHGVERPTILDRPAPERCTHRSVYVPDWTDPCNTPFVPIEPPGPPFPRLVSAISLSSTCLDEWLAEGRTSCRGEHAGSQMRLDVVWTWVNGSDPSWRQSLLRQSRDEGIFSPTFHFRDQGELRYSMRSVLQALPGRIGLVSLVVADRDIFGSPGSGTPAVPSLGLDVNDSSRLRLAQIPHWLDPTAMRCGWDVADPEIRPLMQIVGHSEIFHLPSTGSSGEASVEANWRKHALPSFNSKNIESRFSWIPGLGEVFLSFNDDFFLLSPHEVTDFFSLHSGTVIRLDEGYYQQVRPVRDRKNINDAGETGGLWHANWVLSKRFPKRLRPYLPHVPKVVTRSLHQEANLMFSDDLFLSTQRKFRESKTGNGDIQLQWLSISLRVSAGLRSHTDV